MKRTVFLMVLLILIRVSTPLVTAQYNHPHEDELFVSMYGQLAFPVPAGWLVEDTGLFINLANTRSALDKIISGNPLSDDEIALVFTPPDALPEILGLPANTTARTLLKTVMEKESLTGMIIDAQVREMRAAKVLVSNFTFEGETLIAAFELPQGTVLTRVQTGGSLSDYMRSFDTFIESLVMETMALGDGTAAQPAETMTTVTDRLTSVTTEHLWRVHFMAGETVTIELVALSGDLDPYLYLYHAEDYEANGTPIADNDDSFDDMLGFVNSRIVFSVAQSGDYIIRVSSFNERDTGLYELTIHGDNSYTLEFVDGIAPAEDSVEIRQWATSATGTSHYATPGWSFGQATGAPDTPDCGNFSTAWASSSRHGIDFLRLEFSEHVYPTQVNIYQTNTPGSIIRVELSSSETGEIIEIPDSADPPGNTPCPGVFTLDVSGIESPMNVVTIHLDQTISGNWNEIDAVELVGTSEIAAISTGSSDVAAFTRADDVVSGMLWDQDPRHAWRTSLVRGDRITVTMVADETTLDPMLEIYTLKAYRSGGEPLAVNDDMEADRLENLTLNSQIYGLDIPQSGDYVIVAARFTGSGIYRLAIESTGSATLELMND